MSPDVLATYRICVPAIGFMSGAPSVTTSSAGTVDTMMSGIFPFASRAVTSSPGSSSRSACDWFSSLASASRICWALGGTLEARRHGPVTVDAVTQRSPIGV